MSIKPPVDFYPVLRLESCSQEVWTVYKQVLDSLAKSHSIWAKQGREAHLEISLSSLAIEKYLLPLIDYANSLSTRLHLATLINASDYHRYRAILAEHKLSGFQIFAPGLVQDLDISACWDPVLAYIPGLYTKCDFDLLLTLAPIERLTQLKIFPIGLESPAALIDFLERPFPELDRQRVWSRAGGLLNPFAGAASIPTKQMPKISSPSDYMMIRDYFLRDPSMKLELVSPQDLRADEISGLELAKYLRTEFPHLKLIASGLGSFHLGTAFEALAMTLRTDFNSANWQSDLEEELSVKYQRCLA